MKYHEKMVDAFDLMWFHMLDKSINYLSDELKIARCHLFNSVYEMIYFLYTEGFSSGYIARRLGITSPAVTYRLKKMGVKLRPRGGYNSSRGKDGVTGVYFRKERGYYQVEMYIPGSNGKKLYFGAYNTLIAASVARRFAELKLGRTGYSSAQAHITKHRSCAARGCKLCAEYDLTYLPLICISEPKPLKPRGPKETWPEFLKRAETIVAEYKKKKG